MQTEWKPFKWSCGKCRQSSLRIMGVSAYLNGRLVFGIKCRRCGDEELHAFHPEELTLLHQGPEQHSRFVQPTILSADEVMVSLSPLLRCQYCGGSKGHIRTVHFSPNGLQFTYDCFDCENGSVHPQEIGLEEILAFCWQMRATNPEVPINSDGIDRDLGRLASRPS